MQVQRVFDAAVTEICERSPEHLAYKSIMGTKPRVKYNTRGEARSCN